MTNSQVFEMYRDGLLGLWEYKALDAFTRFSANPRVTVDTIYNAFFAAGSADRKSFAEICAASSAIDLLGTARKLEALFNTKKEA